MKCPCCGAAELVPDTRDMPYTYKGESTTVPSVTGDFCPACGEVVLTREQGDRYSEFIGSFQRQVNAAFVDPAYIRKSAGNLSLTSVRRQNSSVAASMRLPVTRMARPSHRSRW